MTTLKSRIMRAAERWLPIPGFENYQISSLGRIKRGKMVSRGYPNHQGYLCKILFKEGKLFSVKMHRLVLLAFVGPSKLHANHKNGIKSDNRIENLEYLTRTENMRHAYKLALVPSLKGVKNGRSKLTEAQVKEIRRLAKAGLSHQKIASKFSLSRNNVQRIASRKLWKHI